MGRTWLSGIEAFTVEVEGTLDVGRARALAGPDLTVRERDGGAEVSLLALRMKGLVPDPRPAPAGERAGRRVARALFGMDYGEVLFRLGVERTGAAAWLAIGCALDRALVAAFASMWIRYPVTRVARVEVGPGATGEPGTHGSADAWRVVASDRGAEVLCARCDPADDAPPPGPVRPLIVRHRGALLRVPWAEEPAPARQSATATVTAGPLEAKIFGGHARWTRALVHSGRVHRCGTAAP